MGGAMSLGKALMCGSSGLVDLVSARPAMTLEARMGSRSPLAALLGAQRISTECRGLESGRVETPRI